METDSSKIFKCPACGETVFAKDEVCPKCGFRFVKNDEVPKREWIWVIFIALFIFWLAGGKKLLIDFLSNLFSHMN